jgi:hypothetical protein
MAVRKSVDDTIDVAGPRESWLEGCKDALKGQGFTKVEVSAAPFQIKANYKKATTWGDLEVTLLPEGAEATRINAKATANVDNVFAAFSSPGRKILDRFKQGINSANVDTTPAASVPTDGVPASPSVADQIRQLGELRDQGLVTAKEFETKKSELLERM